MCQFCIRHFLSQLLQKVDIDLRTAMDCVNNLQSLMKSCRDVRNNDIYDKIYEKAANLMSPEEISMPRIVKHQTMRSNVPGKSLKKYYLRDFYYLFLDSVILQLDQQFSGHAKDIMRLSSFRPANVVTACFCEVEPAVKSVFSVITGATDKSQSSVPAVAKILSKSF